LALIWIVDKQNFSSLVLTLRVAFEVTGGQHFFLDASLYCSPLCASVHVPLAKIYHNKISKLLDSICLWKITKWFLFASCFKCFCYFLKDALQNQSLKANYKTENIFAVFLALRGQRLPVATRVWTLDSKILSLMQWQSATSSRFLPIYYYCAFVKCL